MATNLWAAVPWEPVREPRADSHIGWTKQKVPYVEHATYLQTLDVWLPTDAESTTKCPPEPSSANPFEPGLWIVYIHGGAWRDPLVDSSSFGHTAVNMLSDIRKNGAKGIVGLASINYRLSPHPNHPTHPAPSREPGGLVDVARTAKHPDHIADVLTALSFLQESGAAMQPYILAGHSCGATLAFQVAMRPERFDLSGVSFAPAKPTVVVGLDGLYDVPAFLLDPPNSHRALVPVYESFTLGAFGSVEDSKRIWPVAIEDWASEWPEGRGVILVQSKEDKLVPYSQLEIMQKHLGQKVAQVEMEAGDDHNELWSKGDRLAQILLESTTAFPES